MSKYPTLRVLLLLVLAVAGLLLSYQAHAGSTATTCTSARVTTNSLDRTLEPVIVKGAQLPAFLGSLADYLFVYAYQNGAWIQVPAQVDEVTSVGGYVAAEDGLWDANDELVFMAQDLGDQAVDVTPVADGAPIDGPWYEVEVTNPLSPSQKAWAYVVRSSILGRTFTADYVSAESFPERINGVRYHLGFARLRQWMDYLTLNESPVDILDRTKIRLYCAIPGICPISEIWFPSSGGLIKDGPVRVITRGGEVLAYGTMLMWTTAISIPIQLPSGLSLSLGLSMDFNDAASRATFYNAVAPAGVTVDGVPDTVPPSPLSPWWQLSTSMGTVIQVSDTSALGGTQTNYYVDDATTFDSTDTGDGKRYADAGVYITDPDLFSTYRFAYYFLPDAQPNIGATYDAYFNHHLSVTAVLRGIPEAAKIYLPVILKWSKGARNKGAGEALILCSPAPLRPCAFYNWSDQHYDDFYTPPDLGVLTPERLGEVLRVEHVRTYTAAEVALAAGLLQSPYSAEAYRILYLSQAPTGTPRAVSGLMVVPTGSVSEDGFPVIAHGHGTTGLADACAPSKYPWNVWGLLSWVAHGYLVSATDYVGLGTPGLHPYIVGEAEAFSMLDGARAALRFSDSARGITFPAANQIILEGHSQGGHAALCAHQAWENYAPELNVLGTVTFAPGSELRFLAQRMARHWSPLVGLGALGMYAYSEYYGAPDTLQAWLREPYATELPDRIEHWCAPRMSLWLGFRPDEVFQPELLEAIREERWDDMQPWTDYMDANTPGNYSSDIPVFILQGKADALIPTEASERLTQRLCAHGTSAKLSLYAGVGHEGITRVGQPEALQWMADRLDGLPAPDSCPTP